MRSGHGHLESEWRQGPVVGARSRNPTGKEVGVGEKVCGHEGAVRVPSDCNAVPVSDAAANNVIYGRLCRVPELLHVPNDKSPIDWGIHHGRSHGQTNRQSPLWHIIGDSKAHHPHRHRHRHHHHKNAAHADSGKTYGSLTCHLPPGRLHRQSGTWVRPKLRNPE